jgi:hypothetical protein
MATVVSSGCVSEVVHQNSGMRKHFYRLIKLAYNLQHAERCCFFYQYYRLHCLSFGLHGRVTARKPYDLCVLIIIEWHVLCAYSSFNMLQTVWYCVLFIKCSSIFTDLKIVEPHLFVTSIYFNGLLAMSVLMCIITGVVIFYLCRMLTCWTMPVRQLNEKQCTQPMLFSFRDRYWVKTDHTAIVVPSAVCTADSFDFLLRIYWDMNVEYPQELRLVFGFIEKLLRLKPTVGKSVLMEDFSQAS